MSEVARKPVAGWHVFTLYGGDVVIGFDDYGKRTGFRHSYWLKVPPSDAYPEGMRMIPGVTGISGLLTEAASGLSPWAAYMAVKHLREKAGIAISDDDAQNAIKAHTDFRDNAAVKGTSVHKFVERIIGGEKITAEERKGAQGRAYDLAAACVKFLEKERIRVVGCEFRVYSLKHCYCGTTDLDVELPDGTRAAIVDVKTSKAFRVSHAMQIASYAKAREEETAYIHEKHGGPAPVVYEDAGVLLAAKQPSIKWLSHAMKMPGKQALDACYNAFLGLLAVRTSIPNLKTFGSE